MTNAMIDRGLSAEAFIERRDKVTDMLAFNSIDEFLVSHLENTRYLCGFSGSTGYLIVRRGGEATLFVDGRYAEQAEAETDSILVEVTARDVLGEILHRMGPTHSATLAFEAAHLSHAEFLRLQSSLPSVRLVNADSWVERARAVKGKGELEAIRRAVEIADCAYEDFLTWITAGMTEREVAARLESFQRTSGADRKPTETVVASGPRSALPHGKATDRPLEINEALMIDIGAVVDGYTSDLTRTIFLGTPPKEFVEIYTIVSEAQKRAEEELRPGMTGKDVDALARDYITDRGYGSYFGHSLGHSIGLEIHERPAAATWEDAALEPGMILTIEPGIYLPGRFGVRIEDNVVITEAGCEVLTQSDHKLYALNGNRLQGRRGRSAASRAPSGPGPHAL